jgi:hypothetical protein
MAQLQTRVYHDHDASLSLCLSIFPLAQHNNVSAAVLDERAVSHLDRPI